MWLIRMVGAIKWIGGFCLAAVSVAQETPFLRVNTRLVEVDVVVHSKGAAVADLNQDDFTVFDNGKPQKIATFSVISSKTTAGKLIPLPPGAVSNRLNTAEPVGTTIVLYDMLNTVPEDQSYGRQALLRYLETSPLTQLHVFPYSDRPGTVASRMAGKVHGAIVRDRGLALRRIGAELTRRFHASQVGTVRAGLTLEDGTLVVTDNYLKVRIPPGQPRNTRVLVRIHGTGSPAQSGTLTGTATRVLAMRRADPAVRPATPEKYRR